MCERERERVDVIIAVTCSIMMLCCGLIVACMLCVVLLVFLFHCDR